MRSVLQNWVMELPLMQQSVLISAIRGVDGLNKENSSKNITRALRKIVLVDAKPNENHSFLNIDDKQELNLQQFLDDIDPYPIHFVLHLLQAIEIVGYKHPDLCIKRKWLTAYFHIVHSFHLNPETEIDLDKRLSK